MQDFWRERERVHKRKQQKVWGEGESGVVRGPETEMLQDCQMIEKAVSCRGCVVGGRAMLPCVISGRGTVFFYYRQSTVHKGLRHYLPPPFPPILLCARALARLARTKLSRLLL